MVETGGVAFVAKVPLANNCGLVTSLLQQLGKSLLRQIENIAVAVEAVLVAILAGKNASAAWAADRVGDIAPVEADTLLRECDLCWGSCSPLSHKR